jgi:hypothetical protein
VQTVTTLGLFLYMRERFDRVMRIVYGGILVAGIGIIAFAYLANPSAKAQTKKPKEKDKTVTQVQAVNCSRYYLTLAELAHHEPDISEHWPAHSLDPQSIACGLDSELPWLTSSPISVANGTTASLILAN